MPGIPNQPVQSLKQALLSSAAVSQVGGASRRLTGTAAPPGV
jgi:hypothetical protein